MRIQLVNWNLQKPVRISLQKEPVQDSDNYRWCLRLLQYIFPTMASLVIIKAWPINVAKQSRRQQQQATLACTPIDNTHETHHCILPMSLSWYLPKLPMSRIENWRETVIFLKWFFSFCESLKMFLNSKKYTHIIFNKKCKNKDFEWVTWRFFISSEAYYQIL